MFRTVVDSVGIGCVARQSEPGNICIVDLKKRAAP